jgi:carbon starvation protein
VLDARDRKLLGLAPTESPAALVGRRLKVSKVLALSNKTLATLGYHADPNEARATSLEDADFARLGVKVKDLAALSRQADEVVVARTGGGVSLAIGMARVFSGIPGMSTLLSYWYHFAIMFEALFVLTTIDTGTRIGRFLMQEFLARFRPSLGASTSKPGAFLATALVVGGWTAFILSGNIQTIWPMFGVANQLLACTALSIGTTILLRESRRRVYALVTFLPLVFVGTTTVVAAISSIFTLYLPMTKRPELATMGYVNAALTALLLSCLLAILVGSVARWRRALHVRGAAEVAAS